MADSFEYTCSQCRESLTLPLSLMGQQGKCPTCHHVETLTDASYEALPTPEPVTTHSNHSPFGGGAPVVAANVPGTENPYATPAEDAFQFESVNPDHRVRLSLTLWGTMAAYTLATIWAIIAIVAPMVSIFTENPERFEGLSDDEQAFEFMIALAESTTDFVREDLKDVPKDKWEERLGLTILTGIGTLLIGPVVLFLCGTVAYLIFFYTLWHQIQDSPEVGFSPTAIVLLQLAPLAVILFGSLLGSISPLLPVFISFMGAIIHGVVMFISYWKLAEYMERYCRQQGIRARQCSPGLALSMCICHVVGAIPFIGLGGLVNLVGLIIWFPVVFGLKNCATDIISHKMAIEQQQQG